MDGDVTSGVTARSARCFCCECWSSWPTAGTQLVVGVPGARELTMAESESAVKGGLSVPQGREMWLGDANAVPSIVPQLIM